VIEPYKSDEALLTSIRIAAEKQRDGLNLWWLGQSGFLLMGSYPQRVLVDPYLSDALTAKYAKTNKPHVRISRRVVEPSRLAPYVDVVTSSHNHTDHLDADTLKPLITAHSRNDLVVVVAAANADFAATRLGRDRGLFEELDDQVTRVSWGIEFTGIAAAHDTVERDHDGHCRYLGYVMRFLDGTTVYHSGDTVVYDGLADRLRVLGPIDVAILPINGKVGNMGGRDAARLAKDIGARVVIPCHYDMFEFNTADPFAEFVPECERIGQPYRVLKLGERFSSSEIPRP
jgi:L-ascorbate metabolism protein UlaG (beta-lactamase superfamily)